MQQLRVATRKSPLALWQAEHVAARLRAVHPGLAVQLVPLTTRGDVLLESPLAEIGGKGLFIKELERALLEGEADIAVHSMKDVPAQLPDGLEIAAVSNREDPSDALVSDRYATLAALPDGARIGTCSLRRQAQLLAHRPGLQVVPLRGNVNTRLARLDAGDFDAIVLASAGLTRLGLSERIRERLSFAVCLPAVGQGIMGIECRAGDTAVQGLVAPLADAAAADCLRAERALGQRLQASCRSPLAAHASLPEPGTLHVSALVAAPDGSQLVRDEADGPAPRAAALGEELAERLLARGAAAILAPLRD